MPAAATDAKLQWGRDHLVAETGSGLAVLAGKIA